MFLRRCGVCFIYNADVCFSDDVECVLFIMLMCVSQTMWSVWTLVQVCVINNADVCFSDDVECVLFIMLMCVSQTIWSVFY